ncbi:hypothetical protein HPB47_003332 [Ixodes persulcatus]|uniref:Uncharacterized protein n=1 Tax=Ixodes persulcatus TaxID=34615 RepID=A0AC60PK94_IXOPE|nr:hypothetical protein HPB47_003332 [Ixodes persulcatus]
MVVVREEFVCEISEIIWLGTSDCHAGPGSRKTTPGGQKQPFQRDDDDDENLSAAQVPDHKRLVQPFSAYRCDHSTPGLATYP